LLFGEWPRLAPANREGPYRHAFPHQRNPDQTSHPGCNPCLRERITGTVDFTLDQFGKFDHPLAADDLLQNWVCSRRAALPQQLDEFARQPL
jgi:hypothetical protein